MPTIEADRFFTVLVEFEVDPDHQKELIDGIADQVEQHFQSYAGFISASFHASHDGRRVINYAQWRSKEAWSAFGRESGHTVGPSIHVTDPSERRLANDSKDTPRNQ